MQRASAQGTIVRVKKLTRTLALSAATALLLAACSSDSSESTTPAVGSEPSASAATSPSGTPTPEVAAVKVEERNGLQDPHPVRWEYATVGVDDMTLTVTWWSKSEGCVGLDSTEVVYGGGSIGVDIIEGDVRTDEPCPTERVLKSTVITLVQPVQGRDIRPLSVV
jgi:hypothetical protein